VLVVGDDYEAVAYFLHEFKMRTGYPSRWLLAVSVIDELSNLAVPLTAGLV
jgi:hypothetical protein